MRQKDDQYLHTEVGGLYEVFGFVVEHGPFLSQGGLVIRDLSHVPSRRVHDVFRRTPEKAGRVHSQDRELLDVVLFSLWHFGGVAWLGWGIAVRVNLHVTHSRHNMMMVQGR